MRLCSGIFCLRITAVQVKKNASSSAHHAVKLKASIGRRRVKEIAGCLLVWSVQALGGENMKRDPIFYLSIIQKMKVDEDRGLGSISGGGGDKSIQQRVNCHWRASRHKERDGRVGWKGEGRMVRRCCGGWDAGYKGKGSWLVLGTLFDPCRLAYLAYTSNDWASPP